MISLFGLIKKSSITGSRIPKLAVSRRGHHTARLPNVLNLKWEMISILLFVIHDENDRWRINKILIILVIIFPNHVVYWDLKFFILILKETIHSIYLFFRFQRTPNPKKHQVRFWYLAKKHAKKESRMSTLSSTNFLCSHWIYTEIGKCQQKILICKLEL
jgi:hypothetical protein